MAAHILASRRPSDPTEFAFILRYREELSEDSAATSERVFINLNDTKNKLDWRFTDLEAAFKKIRETVTEVTSFPDSKGSEH